MVTPEELDEYIIDFYASIIFLRLKTYISPALILTYSLIDILSWLNMPSIDHDVQRGDFTKWTEKYINPKVTLNCDSLDLYGARCGMVHSYNTESKLSREMKVKKIYYVFGNAEEDKINKLIEEQGNSDKELAIDFDALLYHLKSGLTTFLTEKDHDSLVLEKAEKFLRFVPTSWIP